MFAQRNIFRYAQRSMHGGPPANNNSNALNVPKNITDPIILTATTLTMSSGYIGIIKKLDDLRDGIGQIKDEIGLIKGYIFAKSGTLQ
ncbi:hypothetical protein RCL_jg18003.t1 [Rhizophagus clarus]|uniref:Uncharacterized protein n=1 Tax=Rhizophagus clarus TaxID=94130 RepID=A0A8H3L8P4_9GLOM|nr:hypothetical protein RCL_jg18003.t1 [Rhizophagus clarus]